MPAPRTWVLLDDRPGHRTQVTGLADELGWPYEARVLCFNKKNKRPNAFLGAGLGSLDRAGSDPLEPPYPDLVISMGRRCVPIARWIRRASGGHTRLVHLGRKGLTALDEFALLISCAHFNLPPHPRRMAVALPPTKVTAAALARAKADWEGLLDPAKRPQIVLLVGGETAHHRFDAAQAEDIARRAEAATLALGGGLTVVTSRRTAPAAVAVMQTAAPRARFHLWDKGEVRNPYLGYLAWADCLIVTGESESMLAEAAATVKPLYIAPLAPKPLTRKRRVVRWITNQALGAGRYSGLCRRLINGGWSPAFRELEKMHDVMYQSGLARVFATDLSLEPRPRDDAMAEIRQAMRALFNNHQRD